MQVLYPFKCTRYEQFILLTPPPFGNLLIKEWQSLQAGNNLQNMSAKLFYL